MTVADLIKKLSQYDQSLEVFCGDWCTGTNDHDCGQWVYLDHAQVKEIRVENADDRHEGCILTDLDESLKDDQGRKAIYLY